MNFLRKTIKISNGRTDLYKTPEGHSLMTILFQLFAFVVIQNLTDIFLVPAVKPFCKLACGCVDKFISFSSEERAVDKAE